MAEKTTADTADILQRIAQGIDRNLNGPEKRNGFVLLVFPFDAPEGSRTNYVSNADRADMIAALKEMVARFEGYAHAAPAARQ